MSRGLGDVYKRQTPGRQTSQLKNGPRTLTDTSLRKTLQRVQRHMKRCSASLAIREIQIKTTMRYYLTRVRMANINKSTNKMMERMQRKGNPSTLLVGMQTGAATVENSMEFPQKTKNGNLQHCSTIYHSQVLETA